MGGVELGGSNPQSQSGGKDVTMRNAGQRKSSGLQGVSPSQGETDSPGNVASYRSEEG
jgi:hypothetical protein